MGFASYFEDIVDRLSSDLGSLRSHMRGTGGAKRRTPKENKAHAEKLLSLCEEALEQLNREIDAVTDPTLDLASTVKDLRKLVSTEGAKIQELLEKNKSKDGLIKKLNAQLVSAGERERKLCRDKADLQAVISKLTLEQDRLQFELHVKTFKPEHIKKEKEINARSVVVSSDTLKPQDLQGKFGWPSTRKPR